jgi:hypothetical protein
MASTRIFQPGLAKRRDKRLSRGGLHVTVGGAAYPAIDWSLGGVLIDGFAGDLAVGDEVTLMLAREGDSSGQPAPAQVARREDGRVAFHFLALAPDAFKFLEELQMTRLRPTRGR